MKTRHILILVAVLAVLALLTWTTRSRENAGWRTEQEAETLLPNGFNAEEIKVIVVRKGAQNLVFRRTEQGWILDERGGYPVDVSQLGKIVLDLMETRIAQKYKADEQGLGEMMLTPDSGAVGLELKDAQGAVKAQFSFGKRIEKEADQVSMAALYGQAAGIPLGRYVLLPGGEAALVANTFSILDNAPGQWLDQEFIAVDKLKSISLSADGKVLWTLERKEQNAALEIACELPKGYQPDTNVIGAIDRAFSWLPFKDVAVAEGSLKANKILSMKDWNGTSYQIAFGEKTQDGRYMHVSASYDGEDKDKAEKTKALDSRMAKYDYLVIPNAFDAVDRTLVQLCKEAEKEAPSAGQQGGK